MGPNMLRIIRNMFHRQKLVIRIAGRCSQVVTPASAVITGDRLSPTLFAIVLDSVLRQFVAKWPGDTA